MAALGMSFNAADVEPASAREILPAGEYLAHIVNSEMKDTKAGTGQYLSLEFAVLDGAHANRRVFTNLNLVNPNQTAVEIAQRDLSALCHAIGKLQVTDSEQLHNIPLTVVVKVRPAGPDRSGVMRDAQNELGGYKSANGRAAPAARAAAPTPTAKPAAATPPWRKAG